MEDKVYFMPGDLVQLRQKISNKPVMLVIRKETSMFRKEGEEILKGIRCRWFTTSGQLQEAVWNTKDLELVSK